jgi:hypothetical protein
VLIRNKGFKEPDQILMFYVIGHKASLKFDLWWFHNCICIFNVYLSVKHNIKRSGWMRGQVYKFNSLQVLLGKPSSVVTHCFVLVPALTNSIEIKQYIYRNNIKSHTSYIVLNKTCLLLKSHQSRPHISLMEITSSMDHAHY